ncbi:hypothetical protein TeGR_g11345, partial [Tetraparma gracilis]
MESSAVLDVDDTNFYGPETITIKNPHPGTYSYFINIYGNGKCWDTSGIRAQIEVWSGEAGGLIKRMTQPVENPDWGCSGSEGTTCHQVWHVLDFDGTKNEFNFVNEIVPYGSINTAMGSDGSGESWLPETYSCTCRENTSSEASSTSSWRTAASGAAGEIYAQLLGPDGEASQAMCVEEIQEKYAEKSTEDDSHSAEAVAADLASKVRSRFQTRIAQTEALQAEAVDFYDEETINGGGSTSSPEAMCEDTCQNCVYDAAFFGDVDRTSYGVRYGARADVDGTAREKDEEVIQRLGDAMTQSETGAFAEDPTTKWFYYGAETGLNVIAPQ